MRRSPSSVLEHRKETWPISRGSRSESPSDEIDAISSALIAGPQDRSQNCLGSCAILGPVPSPHLAIDDCRPDRLFRGPVRGLHSSHLSAARSMICADPSPREADPEGGLEESS